MAVADARQPVATDRHHHFYNRRWYTGPLERMFREHPAHISRIPTATHRHLHATQRAPVKPSRLSMLLDLVAHESGQPCLFQHIIDSQLCVELGTTPTSEGEVA